VAQHVSSTQDFTAEGSVTTVGMFFISGRVNTKRTTVIKESPNGGTATFFT
jgi:hypothetical protein